MNKRQRFRARIAMGILIALGVVAVFLLGRLEGWAEADRFMSDLARDLAAIAPPSCQ